MKHLLISSAALALSAGFAFASVPFGESLQDGATETIENQFQALEMAASQDDHDHEDCEDGKGKGKGKGKGLGGVKQVFESMESNKCVGRSVESNKCVGLAFSLSSPSPRPLPSSPC